MVVLALPKILLSNKISTFGGFSEFVGVATFRGGTINLGDADTDDINVAGEFISNLIPNVDDSFDIGQGVDPKRWRHANFSGVGTFATGAVADAIQIGITGASEIDTSSGDLNTSILLVEQLLLMIS
jgi:hypothetical protein